MLVERGSSGKYFTSLVQFTDSFDLDMSLYYELEFKYLINVDICNRPEIVLEAFFYDQVSVNQTVFNSVLDDDSSISNSKWNGVKKRFKIVTSGRYYLAVLAQGYCEIEINDAFIAVDSIELYEYSNLPTSTTTTTTTSTTTTTTTSTTTTTTTTTATTITTSTTSTTTTTITTIGRVDNLIIQYMINLLKF